MYLDKRKPSNLTLVFVIVYFCFLATVYCDSHTSYASLFPTFCKAPVDVTYQCPSGWTTNCDECYRFYDVPLSWQDADKACSNQGGELVGASPELGTKIYIAKQFLVNKQLSQYWIQYSNADQCRVVSNDDDNSYPQSEVFCNKALPFFCRKDACQSAPTAEFSCSNGKCIKATFKCDGVNDCGDNSDELDCSSQCRNVITLGDSQTSALLSSPSYPNYYSNNKACSWLLVGPVGSRLQLVFNYFNTEPLYDILNIYVGGSTLDKSQYYNSLSGPQVVSGSNTLKPIISVNNYMYITFSSDATGSSSSIYRFQATWSKATIVSTSEVELTSTSSAQVFTSPSYPTGYPSNTKLTWKIKATGEFQLVTLMLKNVYLAMGDTVKVYDGTMITKPVLAELKGPITIENSQAFVQSSGRYLYITMDTTSLRGDKGFSFSYISGCDITLEATSGMIQSPGYQYKMDSDTNARSYPTLATCTYLIKLPAADAAKSLTLNMQSINIQDTNDKLEIFKGNSATGTPFLTINSANQVTNSLPIDNTGTLSLKFTSDAFNPDNTKKYGFRAWYSVGCEDPKFNNETIKPNTYGTRYTSKFEVSCKTGYYFAQQEFGQCGIIPIVAGKKQELECQFGGRWSVDRLPQCEAVFCVNVPDVFNGFITNFTSAQFGSKVHYSCYEGFNLQNGATGDNSVTCLQDGSWSGSPKCNAQSCAALVSSNSTSLTVTHLNGDRIDFGSVVRFECNPGYQLTAGDPVIYCRSNGSWSGPISVTCTKLQCFVPMVKDGTVGSGPGNLVNFNDPADLVCKTGYVLFNTTTDMMTLTCSANQTFGMIPDCVNLDECTVNNPCVSPAMCSDTVGSYKCNCPSGYKLTSNLKECANIDECADDTDGCYPDQGNTKYCTDITPGYTCSCPTGMELFSMSPMNGFSIKTGETGLRMGDVYRLNHTCIPKTCPDPTGGTPFGNGTMMNYKKTYFYRGDTVQFLCNLGYGIEGVAVTANPESKTLTCKDDGTWDAPLPMCVDIMCDAIDSQADFPSSFRNEPLFYPYGKNQKVPYGETIYMNCTVPGRDPRNFLRSRKCLYNVAEKKYSIIGDDIECGEINCGVPQGLSGFETAQLPTAPDGTKYDSTFNFQCASGFSLLGNTTLWPTTVKCLADGTWNLGDLRCSGAPCSDPGTPPGGYQTAISYEEGKVAKYGCDRPGYLPNYPELTCVKIGAKTLFVSGSGTTTPVVVCQDKEDPKNTNCPSSMQYVYRYSMLNYKAMWTDNSGAIASAAEKRTVGSTSSAFDFRQPIIDPTYSLQSEATDHAGNTGLCQINVTVRNEILPSFVSGCPNPSTVFLKSETETRSIDVASTYGVNVTGAGDLDATSTFNPMTVTINKAMLYMPQVLHQTAMDQFDNKATCTFAIVVMPEECANWHFRDMTPKDGSIVFTNTTKATVTCNDGYTFYSAGSVPLVYECEQNVGFTNSIFGTYVPQCVAPTKVEYLQQFKVRYTVNGLSLNQGSLDQYINFLTSTAIPQSEAFFKTIAPRCTNNNIEVKIAFNETADVQFSLSQIDVKFRFNYITTSNNGLQTCVDSIKVSIEGIANDPQFPLRLLNPPNLTPIAAIFEGYIEDGFSCPAGQFLQVFTDSNTLVQTQSCTPCPAGYFSENNVNCTKCPIGQYQDLSGMTSCKPCQSGQSTYNTGAASQTLCYNECPAPLASLNGLAPCQPCMSGQYRETANKCTACPGDTKTRGPIGGYNSSYCYEKCPAGSFSYDGYGPECRPCPKGYYSLTVGSNTCTACDVTKSTLVGGSNATAACVDSNALCSDKCINGTCSITNNQITCTCTPGFTGTYCETEINECDSQPCYFGGSCMNKVNGYECICPPIIRIHTIVKAGQIPQGLPDSSLTTSNSSPSKCSQACIDNANCKVSLFRNNTNECYIYTATVTSYLSNPNAISYERFINDSVRYGGVNCEDKPNNCPASSDPGACQNGGQCQDLDSGFKCLCPTLDVYTGPTCSDKESPCQNANCTNGGTCVSDNPIRFKCKCAPGFTGKNCETNINDCNNNTCLYGGMCTDLVNGFKCSCPTGFTGSNCQTRPANLCANNRCGSPGKCVQDYITSQPQCVCERGYAGTSEKYDSVWYNADTSTTDDGDIETIQKHNSGFPCGTDKVVGTECRVVSTKMAYTTSNQVIFEPCTSKGLICYNANQTANAKCVDYEVRYKCEVDVDICREINECTLGKCQHGSVCENRVDDYSCKCRGGYEGFNCQLDVKECATNPCQHGGKCQDYIDYYNCTCLPGYQGVNCETNPNNCLSNPCDTTGTQSCEDRVDDFYCKCKPGYTGKNCSENINECASNPCLHNGECVDKIAEYECKCKPGWTEDRCEKMVEFCQPTTCANGGKCFEAFTEYFCSCQPGYAGETCMTGNPICSVANPCKNGGTCKDVNGKATCTCPNDYDGEGCQCQRDYCNANANICQNGGTCSVSTLGSYRCGCITGFTGNNCQTNTNDCANKNCGPGTCIDGVGVAFCSCPPNKAGNQCEKDIDRNFDMQFTSTGVVSTLKPFMLNTTDFTFGFWVRFENDITTNTAAFVNVFSTSSLTSTAESGHILSLDNQQFTVSFDGTMTGSNTYTVQPNNRFNNGQWHFIVLTMNSQAKEAKMYVDAVSKQKSFNITKLSEFAVVKLGSADFRGYISMVQLWDRVLSALEISTLNTETIQKKPFTATSGLVLSWEMGGYSSAAGVIRRGVSTRGELICKPGEAVELVNTQPTCKVQTDKIPPVATNCPASIPSKLPTTGQRSVNFNGAWDINTFFDGGQISANYKTDDVFSQGRYKLIVNSVDSNGNRAACKFNVFVRLGNCDNTIPSGRCTTGSCPLSCTSTTSFLRTYLPQLPCDSAGIYNTQKPLVPYGLPQCGPKATTPQKKKLTFGWNYDIPGFSISQDQQTNIETSIKAKIQTWSDSFGNIKVCAVTSDCSDFVITTTVLGLGKLQVSIVTSQGVSSTINGFSIEDLVVKAVTQDDIFYLSQFGTGAVVDISTLTLTSALYCEANFQAAEELALCVGCPAGTAYNSSTKSCILCDYGSYQDGILQTTCKQCNAGETTQTRGSAAQADCFAICPAGQKFDIKSTKQCVPCGNGFYQPDSGKTFCFACEVGKTTRENNATASSQCFDTCNDGNFLTPSGTCEPCPVGSYRKQGRELTCQQCRDGYVTPSTGSVDAAACTVRVCPAGQSVSGTNCIPCLQSTYRTINMVNCTACPTNTRTDSTGAVSNADCKFFCSAGSFINNATGSNVCELCPRDYYKDSTKYYATVCDKCSDSKPRTAGTGSKSADDCRFGNCGAGEYIDPNNLQACLPCPYDTYQSNTDPVYLQDNCTKCETNFGTNVMAANASSFCMRFCPSGEQLESNTCVKCERGYYKENNPSDALSKFAMCKLCSNDKITDGTGATAASNCSVGNCTAGQYINGGGCLPCPIGTYSTDKWQPSCTMCPTESTTSNTGSTSQSDCSVFPNRTILQVAIRIDLPYSVEYQNIQSTPYTSFATLFLPNALVMFKKVSYFRGTSVTIGLITPGSLNVPVSGQFDINPNAKTDLLNVVSTQIGSGSINGISGLPTIPSDQNSVNVLVNPQNWTCVNGNGNYYNQTTSSCMVCPIGTYMPLENTLTAPVDCLPCPSPQTTASTGSTSATQCKRSCPAGQEDVNNVCVACQVNYAKSTPGIQACTACGSGYVTYSTDTVRTTCRQSCVAGQYNKVDTNTGLGNCVTCPKNQYSTAANLLQCTPCPGNSETTTTGASSASMCRNLCQLNTSYCNNVGECIISADLTTATCRCNTNYIGTRCETRTVPKSGNFNTIIGAAVGGFVGLLLLILLIVCICRNILGRGGEQEKPIVMNQYPQGSVMVPVQAATTYDPSIQGYYPAPSYYPTYGTQTFSADPTTGAVYDSSAFVIYDEKEEENGLQSLIGSQSNNAYTLQSLVKP